MNSKHCPACYSTRVIKKGKQNSRQRYQCKNCEHRWERAKRTTDISNTIWADYSRNNKTIESIRQKYGLSEASVREILQNYPVRPPQELLGLEYEITTIILDATYISRKRSHGILVAIDAISGKALYAKELLGSERVRDYEEAIRTLLPHLPNLKACVIDGRKGVREMILGYGLVTQHCQFHEIAFVTQRLSRHPKTEAGIKLRGISLQLTESSYTEIESKLIKWAEQYETLLKEKTYYTDHDGRLRWRYKHRNLRSAYNSLKRNLPYLYTYQQYPSYNIPNTSNRIDGQFGVIKKHIRTHSGCSLAIKIKLWFYFLSVGIGVKKN